MLSAFTAEPIIELKQRDKSKIESILAHGDNLLVGLSTGALRIYRVNNTFEQDSNPQETQDDTSKPKSKPTELLRELDKFSKSKVEQLAIFKEANILISLSNGLISIHDLGTYELQEQLTNTKGTTLFAATSNIVQDVTTNVPTLVSRLAVAVRRRLLLWSWHDGELAGNAEEFTLSNTVKSLTWATGTKILVGLNPNYVMLDIETQQQKNIIGPGSIGGQPGSERGTGTLSYIGMGSMVPTPLATGLGPEEMLLAKDVNTHFIDRSGESLGRRQIPWRSTPKAVGYSYPFLLALQEPSSSKGVLEVRNPQTLTSLQSIELPSAHLMQVPNPGISLAHQGKGFLVASDRVIWRMKGLHYDAQVDALVSAGQLDEAISLLEIIEETLIHDKDGRLREIKMQKAQKLFDEGKFRDALDLFSEVSAPPERVIKLYPELISGSLALQRPESPLESLSPKANRPESISSKVSIERVKKQASDAASVVSGVIKGNGNGSDKELKSAVRELQSFLADIRRRLSRFFAAEQEVRSLSELKDGPQADDNKNVIEHILQVDDQDESKMKEKLLETAQLVDTTLFRAHMFATPSLAGSLFRITNHCDPEVVMTKLEETERYSELIDFLYGKRLHRKALERLQKFGQSDKTDEIDPQLHGPDRTVSYLQNLPPEMIDIILEFARWPMVTKPEIGMEIFVADTENAESLPRDKVLGFLESVGRPYAIRYLEHIIDELDDLTPELHQRLVTLYFEELNENKEEVKDVILPKLLTLLRQSTQYSAAKTLALLPRDEPLFYEAMAIVYSKMGQHRQALQIYVFKLDDTAKAEEYCNQVYLQEITTAARKTAEAASRRISTTQAQTEDPTSETSTIYALLLSLYLTPPPATPPEQQAEPRITDALSLLTRHGPRLPATSTLSVIPTDLLVKELAPYLRGRIRTANTAMNDVRVVANLRKVEAVRVQARLLLGMGPDGDPGADLGALGELGMSETVAKGRRAKVVIDEERICRVCHKRLGGSVISAFPDGTVVHLGCQGRREQEIRNAAGTSLEVK